MLRLRALPLRQRITSQTRFQSTLSFSQRLQRLQETHKPSHTEYKKLLTHPQIAENIDSVAKLFKIVESDSEIKDEHKAELHNIVLKDLLQHDSSLVSHHMRSLAKMGSSLDVEALDQVIKLNKGRVDSSWEIFEKWCQQSRSLNREGLQSVLKSVLNKVVYGDPSEQEEGFKLARDGLLKAVWLMKNMETVEPEIKAHVMLEALKANELALVGTLGVETLEQINHLSPADEKLVFIWSVFKDQKLEKPVNEADVALLERILVLLTKRTEMSNELWGPSTVTMWDALNHKMPETLQTEILEKPEIDHDVIFDNLVKSLEPYTNSSSGLYTSLRQSLLKCYGIYHKDFQEASKLYSEYIVDDKYNVDSYMETMTQVSCYLAAESKNKIYLQLAESMVPPEHTPVKSLRAQILAYSMFDSDKSLDIYNEWISKLSKKNNEHGISQAGLLTESLILAFLVNGEREFAYVVRDGAIGHGMVEGDNATDRIKAVFKRYGEALGQQEETGDKGLLQKEVLLAIDQL